MLQHFTYLAPRTRAELHSVLADEGDAASLLAGGTDLLVNVRAGVARPKVVVDTKKVADFAGIDWSERDGLVIRASATINAVLDDAKIRSDYPLLIACAHDLASHQIRNRATVVGNVVNASPCADMSPALLCLRARAVIGSKGGERENGRIAQLPAFRTRHRAKIGAHLKSSLLVVSPPAREAR